MININPKLAELADARGTFSPLIDKMLDDFHREVEKLPPPPPGYYYYPQVQGVRQEGDTFIVDSEINLRPIISTEE